MKFINRPRGSGKTYMMVITSDITGYPIITNTESQKDYIHYVANKLNCEIQVFTLKEYQKYQIHLPFNKVLIDECQDIVEKALEYYLNAEVVAGTMTVPIDKS